MFLILFVSRYLPISAPPFSIDTVLTFSINSPVPIWSSDYMYMLITDPLTSNGVRGIFEHFVLSPSREHDYSAVRSGVGLGNKVKMDIWHHSYVQPQVVSPMLWESYPMLHYGSIVIDGPIVLILNHFCNNVITQKIVPQFHRRGFCINHPFSGPLGQIWFDLDYVMDK